MSKAMFKRPNDNVDIRFHVNGEEHVVSDKFLANTSLNDYLRSVAGLKGTKVMCKEGGCGCCAVTVTHKRGSDSSVKTASINSCLCPLYSVDGWQITTVEGIGNQKDGFHKIQERVAKHNATQCGYCTPGFVMSMYGLLHQDQALTQEEIEKSLDSHICRCTGYRPILDAMKSFGTDADGSSGQSIDIEDLNKHLCPKTGEVCNKTNGCHKSLAIDLRESKWYRPCSLKELGGLLQGNKKKTLKMVYGNTSSGIYKEDTIYDVYIDLHEVKELQAYEEQKNSIVFGAGTTLSEFKQRLKSLRDKPTCKYMNGIVKHLEILATVLIRNAGTIGGNLMIKQKHNEFPSDLFVMMETIGAHVHVYDSKTSKQSKHGMEEFLFKVSMDNKVIASLELPKLPDNEHFRSFKITPRSQNAHAHVSAAFRVPMNQQKVSSKPAIVYGGIRADFVHAKNTEAFLQGKKLEEETIKEALRLLNEELKATDTDPLIASCNYRTTVAVNLLYKVLTEMSLPNSDQMPKDLKKLERPLSHGTQTYQEKKETFPLKEAMPKLEAPIQASGEAVYTDDIPAFQHELYGALVISNVGEAKIEKVDPSEALNIAGVHSYIDANDIPKDGMNNFVDLDFFVPSMPKEPIFASDKIEYAGQPIGLILADTQSLAEMAARKVKVSYSDVKEAVIDIEDAIEKGMIFDDHKSNKVIGSPDEAMKDCDVVVSGKVKEGVQYHFYMENQITIAVPSEDSMDIYSATQFQDNHQRILSKVMNKPLNYFNMRGHRLGGSFGGKGLYAMCFTAAAAIASNKTRRPVRVVANLETAIKLTGKRFPILANYKAGCDKDGKVKVIDADLFVDCGFKSSFLASEFVHMIDQGYYIPNWRINFQLVKTHKATGTPCRAPGSVPAALVMESILEHVAKEAKMHPILLKEINLYEQGQTDFNGKELTECSLRDIWNRLKQTAQVESRMEAVENFNKNNKWQKRGITMTAVKYAITHMFPPHACNVSIFAGDGSISVATTGVEMGQGLYSKVAQTVAATLEVPLSSIKVKTMNSDYLPNAGITGGSSGSELCVGAALNACKVLKERIQPIREKMPDADWLTILATCNMSMIDLGAKSVFSPEKGPGSHYNTYCTGVVETQVDVLTGEYLINRVDIMVDFGESLNPTIDIGQIEGAFVFGIGAYLLEDFVFDKKSGEILNAGTWEYNPPVSKDIPIDWRIHFIPDRPNPVGILSSKAVGEPPIGLAVGALLSIKSSIEDFRKQVLGQDNFINVGAPYSVEKIQQSSGLDLCHLFAKPEEKKKKCQLTKL